jgi:NAD(P)-dependent dehydrogenase (short-subunit alcohol dehydrogenase family)
MAKAIAFLSSDEAAFAVGSELVVDGGMSNL